MSKKSLAVSYLFLLVVPYIICLMMIGTSYNALVIHSGSFWRTFVAAFVGSCVLTFLKIIANRPIRILKEYTTNHPLSEFINSLDIVNNKKYRILNFGIDGFLSACFTWIIRHIFSFNLIFSYLNGYLITALIISLIIASYSSLDEVQLDQE